MKLTLLFSAVFYSAVLLVASCASPQDTERLQRIGDIALTYAERTGKISPEDAAIAREAGALIISKDTPATVVVVPSRK